MKCERCGTEMAYRALSDAMVCPACGHVARPEDDVERRRADALAILRTALLFYADEANYRGAMPVLADGGQLAREALARAFPPGKERE